MALLFLDLVRQSVQQFLVVLHFLSHSSSTFKHLRSLRHSSSTSSQYFIMQSWGSSNFTISTALSHPLAWAHLATSIADWLPLLGRHKVQQEALVPHFFWQSSRAARHLGSFWQVAHWVGHFYSMHFWGSASVIVEISMANESKAIDNIRTGIFIVDFISI